MNHIVTLTICSTKVKGVVLWKSRCENHVPASGWPVHRRKHLLQQKQRRQRFYIYYTKIYDTYIHPHDRYIYATMVVRMRIMDDLEWQSMRDRAHATPLSR